MSQTEYDQILKKLRELPHVKHSRIIGPPCYPGTHEDIAKLETPENIDKMIETIMMMEELESLDIEFVYGLNNASFVYDLTNLTSIDLSYNGLPDEEVERIHQFINGKQKVYPN